MYYSVISSMKKQNIVTNGLNLYLDAAQSISYPGAGTIWTDLSVNANNGTLVNGPTYSSANGGCIVFDGTNQYVNLGNNSTLNITNNITVLIWIKGIIYDASDSIISRWDTGLNKRSFDVFVNSSGQFGVQLSTNGDFDAATVKQYVINTNTFNGSWNQIGFSFSSNNLQLYTNGVLSTVSKLIDGTVNSLFSTNVNLWIAANQNNGTGQRYSNMNVSHALIYNRTLSGTEILQNYNVLKGRYL